MRNRGLRALPRSVIIGLIVAGGAVSTVSLMSLHDFLAVNSPVKQGILVVEAWVPTHALAEVPSVFASGNYRYLVVVGYPIEPAGGPAPGSTYADRAVRELERGGFGNATMVELRVPLQSSRKTYASALTVRDWLIRSKLSIKHVDVFTVGVHARKSWILFQHALGDNYHVGVIAGTPMFYNPNQWLLSPNGIRLVARNLGGYLYSKLLTFLDRAHSAEPVPS